MNTKQKPIHEIRIGAVKAAIWENIRDEITRHNVTFTRLYRDDDEWKSSDSFGRDNLPLLCTVADQAPRNHFVPARPHRDYAGGA